MKQVIVVNEALKLPRGKLSAQVAHASIASFLLAESSSQQAWLKVGMPKVVLSAASEEEILSIYKTAQGTNLPTRLIKDAGKTVVSAGTITCVGIGPAKATDVNKVTGDLKLIG